MKPRTSSRLVVGCACTLAAAIGGIVARASLPRSAFAQTSPPSTIYVPSAGLIFRSLDGKPVAKLTRGERGGVLELYDDRSDRFMKVAVDRAAAVPACPYSYSVDDDPWGAVLSPNPARPGPGF